jgi:hypothetical protein
VVKLARQLDEWHRDGTLSDDDRGLNVQPYVASFLAWLCENHPQKSFFDLRLENYSPEAADDYVQLRQAFEPQKDGEKQGSLVSTAPKWEPILRRQKITYVIVSDPYCEATRQRCAGAPEYLAPLYMDGHSAVYALREAPLKRQPNAYLAWLQGRFRGWRMPPLPPEPAGGARFGDKEFDTWEQAFGPRAEPLGDQAPRAPRPLAWWMRFAYGRGTRAPESADAATYYSYFRETAFAWHYEHVMRPRATLSFAAVPAAFLTGGSGNAVSDVWNFNQVLQAALGSAPPAEFDDLSPLFDGQPIYTGRTSPLVLAVRSARRAVLQNPDDADAYMQLALAYVALPRESEEHRLGARLTLLSQVRQAQALAALRSAVLLAPDHIQAHQWLAVLYGRPSDVERAQRRPGYLDLRLKHLEEVLRVLRKAGRFPGETEDEYNDRLKPRETEIKDLDKLVKDNQNKYEIRAEKKQPVEKAVIALELGLAEKALQVLLESSPVELKEPGMRLQLDLELRMGRFEDLRAQLVDNDASDPAFRRDLNDMLGTGSYEVYRFLLAAAEGNYAEADKFLAEAEKMMFPDEARLRLFRVGLDLERDKPGPAKELDLRQLIAAGLVKSIAEHAPVHGPVVELLQRRGEQQKHLQLLDQMVAPFSAAANYETLRGILKTEAGDIPGAAKNFRRALYFDQDSKQARPALDFAGLPLALRYLQLIEQKE